MVSPQLAAADLSAFAAVQADFGPACAAAGLPDGAFVSVWTEKCPYFHGQTDSDESLLLRLCILGTEVLRDDQFVDEADRLSEQLSAGMWQLLAMLGSSDSQSSSSSATAPSHRNDALKVAIAQRDLDAVVRELGDRSEPKWRLPPASRAAEPLAPAPPPPASVASSASIDGIKPWRPGASPARLTSSGSTPLLPFSTPSSIWSSPSLSSLTVTSSVDSEAAQERLELARLMLQDAKNGRQALEGARLDVKEMAKLMREGDEQLRLEARTDLQHARGDASRARAEVTELHAQVEGLQKELAARPAAPDAAVEIGGLKLVRGSLGTWFGRLVLVVVVAVRWRAVLRVFGLRV